MKHIPTSLAVATLLLLFYLFMAVPVSAKSVLPRMNENLYGMNTTAGAGAARAGSVVCRVVTLADDGDGSDDGTETNQDDGVVSGSLRYCLADLDVTAANHGKTVIFDVSGVIDLSGGSLQIGSISEIDDSKWSYITIAGQTAPFPGITLKGKLLIERNSHDILIQHLRFRFDDENLNGSSPAYVDALGLDNHYRATGDPTWTPPYNIVIDHCSFSWAIDENLESGGDNVTLSNSIIGEGLSDSLHTEEHSKGMHFDANNDSVTGNHSAAVIQNLFIHNKDRNPAVESGYVLISNNLIMDYWLGINITDGPTEIVKVSIAGNYFIPTDIETYCIYIKMGRHADSRAYIAGDNYFDGSIQAAWNGDVGCFEQRTESGVEASDVAEANRAATGADALWPDGYTQMTAAEAKAYVIANAGAWPGYRDTVDARLIAEAVAGSGTSALIDVIGYTDADCTALDEGPGGIDMQCCTGSGTGTCRQNDEGGWPTLAANTRALTLPASPNTVAGNGYTNLENWLHGYSDIVEGRGTRLGTGSNVSLGCDGCPTAVPY